MKLQNFPFWYIHLTVWSKNRPSVSDFRPSSQFPMELEKNGLTKQKWRQFLLVLFLNTRPISKWTLRTGLRQGWRRDEGITKARLLLERFGSSEFKTSTKVTVLREMLPAYKRAHSSAAAFCTAHPTCDVSKI